MTILVYWFTCFVLIVLLVICFAYLTNKFLHSMWINSKLLNFWFVIILSLVITFFLLR